MSASDTDNQKPAPGSPIARATAMADALPVEQAAKLLADLPHDGGRGEEKVAPIRQALVNRLNSLRPQRARRLFTSLVEPLLIDDPEAIEAIVRAPLAFRRADMGGIWGALARVAFPEEAVAAAQLLERLCQDCLVDEALALPEAAAMRERLRIATLTRLARLAADKAEAETFLALANATRELQYGPRARTMAPISWPLLQELAAVLAAHPILMPAIDAHLATLGPGQPAEAAGVALAGATLALGRTLNAAGLPAGIAEALPIAVLNRRTAYGVVANYLRERGSGNDQRVGEALSAHLAIHLHAFSDEFRQLTPETRREETPLMLPADTQERLRAKLGRVEDLVAAIRQAGLLDSPRLQPMLREITNVMAIMLGKGPLQRTAHRYAAATLARHQAVIDDHEIRQLVIMLVHLRAILRPTGLPIHALGKWRDQLIADTEFALHKATRLDDETEGVDDLLDRFRHLERIETLAELIGHTVIPVLQPTSRHTQIIIATRLADEMPLGDLAHRICAGFAAAIRGEIAKVRYWRNPDMVTLAELAASRGL